MIDHEKSSIVSKGNVELKADIRGGKRLPSMVDRYRSRRGEQYSRIEVKLVILVAATGVGRNNDPHVAILEVHHSPLHLTITFFKFRTITLTTLPRSEL